MSTFVLDTSVAIAWYFDESFSQQAREWQQRLIEGRVTLRVPSLHFEEFANVLRTLTKRGEIDAPLAREVYELHLDAPLSVSEPDRRGLLDVALDYGATAYDAVYILVALEHDVRLLTAEKATTPWVKKMGEHAEVVGA